MDENKKGMDELEAKGTEIVEKIKELVKKGNVSRIRVLKDEKVILNIPVTVGAAGAVVGLAAAPWALILAALAAIGFKCRVEVEKEDGTVTTIYG